MAAPRVERRLAAILAADVAGYSRLMERDEAGTLARLKAHRQELIEPLVAGFCQISRQPRWLWSRRLGDVRLP